MYKPVFSPSFHRLTRGTGFRRCRSGILLAGLLLLTMPSPLQAWDIRLGYHYLMPKLGTHQQEYVAADGESLTLAPNIRETITGHALSLGLGFDNNVAVVAEQSQFEYDTLIPEKKAVVPIDTEAVCTVVETRLGVSYHLERELAGLLLGGGLTAVRETLSTAEKDWTYETLTPYGTVGIDLVFGGLRTRLRQTHYGLGRHAVKVNSFGVLLVF